MVRIVGMMGVSDTDVGGGSTGNVGSDDGFHSGGDVGVIMAMTVDSKMVRTVVLVREAMMLAI